MPRPALAQEQAHLDTMYERLDQVRDRVRRRLDAVLSQPGGTRQAASERDAAADGYADQIARYDAAETDLCFGRLDLDDGEFLHIGRIGLFDVAEDDRPLLVDWRAPAARAFYVATAVTRHGVARRRYIRTRRRTVVGVDDDVLGQRPPATGDDAAPDAGPTGDRSAGAVGGHGDELAGEAALMSALEAPRTGRMRDIVATIQAEQDHAIRSDLPGVVVVQGGPGTGKTAVALHRAAYLLFTHRELLARRGVLVLGPNATFLRYISQVLPSLAETGVVSWTVGQLFPGVDARVPEPDESAAVKGHLDMAAVIAAAVRDRQEVPDGVLEVLVDGERLELDPATCEQARGRARAAGGPHNEGRQVFLAELAAALARQLALRIGYDPYGFDPLGEGDAPGSDTVFDEAEVAELAKDLERDPAVAAVVDRLWPRLTPQRLLADLWDDPERMRAAAPHLTQRERRLLRRTVADPARDWTPADVPLLDEAAELLGDAEDRGPGGVTGRPGGTDVERRNRIEYAQGVLDVAAGSRSIDLDAGEGILQASDLLDARGLAERHAGADRRSAAERAAADRRWTFGHVIVDEAQDVSPMAWRALMRRCPTRSMTLAGDLAQAGAPGSTTTWRQVLAPYVGDRWRLEELTLSYRTPAEILSLAAGVLARVNPALAPPRAVRTGGARPWAARVPAGGLVAALVEAAGREVAAVEAGDGAGGEGRGGGSGLGAGFGGSVAVIVPAAAFDGLAPRLSRAVPGLSVSDDPDLEAPVVLLTPRRAKGLEFDAVLVVEPQRILADSVRGASDLYVALTRATKRLGLIHSEPLPEVLDPASVDLVDG